MEIAKYIKELISDSDCVIIPNFGGIVGNYKSAQIHPITHLFTPPSKTIAFNAKLNSNDGYLVDTIVNDLKITSEEALQLIDSFVFNINTILNSGKKYILDEIGSFFRNSNNSIQFEPIKENYPLADSFGMTEFFAKPIEREDSIKLRNSNIMSADQNQPIRRPVGQPRPGQPVMRKKVLVEKQPKPEKNRDGKSSAGLKIVLILLPIVILLGAGAYFITSHENMNFASLNPFASKEQPAIVEEEGSVVSNEGENESNEENTAWSDTNVEGEEVATTESVSETENVEETPSEEVQTEDIITEEENVVAEVVPVEEELVVEEKELSFFDKILDFFGLYEEELPKEVKEDEVLAEKNGWAEEVEEVQEKEPVVEDKPVVEVKKSSSSGSKTISNRTDRYYVIAGAFENPENATKYREEMDAKGYDAKILEPRGIKNVYRVSIADYPTQKEGLLKTQAENDGFGFALWVLKY